MDDMEKIIQKQYPIICDLLDERKKRLSAGSLAEVIGYSGISTVARATGMSAITIKKGIEDLSKAPHDFPKDMIRNPGGGRKSNEEIQPDLMKTLESLIAPLTKEDPAPSLRWTCKSTRKLSEELANLGYQASNCLVHTMLKGLGYSLNTIKKFMN
jgi:hypothetical protein